VPDFVQTLSDAKNPMVVVGSALLQRGDGGAIFKAVSTIAQNARVQSGCGEDWKVLNVLQRVSNIQPSNGSQMFPKYEHFS